MRYKLIDAFRRVVGLDHDHIPWDVTVDEKMIYKRDSECDNCKYIFSSCPIKILGKVGTVVD